MAEGNRANLRSVAEFVDSQFEAGDQGEYRFTLYAIPWGFEVALDKALRTSGVKLLEPVHSIPGRTVVVRFETTNPGPLVIVLVIGGVLLALGTVVLLTTWTLYKIVTEVGGTLSGVTALALVVVIGAVAFTAKRKGKG